MYTLLVLLAFGAGMITAWNYVTQPEWVLKGVRAAEVRARLGWKRIVRYFDLRQR